MQVNPIKFISVLIVIFFPFIAIAHPGRTDSAGCHTCKTNCSSWGLSYGEYHCHQSKELPQPETPIKSHNDGTTEPAPEYSQPLIKTEAPNMNNYAAGTASNSDNSVIWGVLIAIGAISTVVYFVKKKNNK
jgi:hypothetical protein